MAETETETESGAGGVTTGAFGSDDTQIKRRRPSVPTLVTRNLSEQPFGRNVSHCQKDR